MVTSVAAGYVIGNSNSKIISNSSEQITQDIRVSTPLKNKLNSVTDIDLKEYQSLKSQKEKYDKANEILQKILKIFLLDLGLRMNDGNKDILLQAITAPQPNVVTANANNTKPIIENSPDSIVTKNNILGQVQNIGSKQWVKNESKAADISNDEDAKAFLKSVEIKDFFKNLKTLKPVSKTQFNKINGSFWGKAHVFVKNKNVVWDVEIDITDTSTDEKLSADTLIKMFQDGKRFSKSTGNGHLKNIRSLNGSKLAIVVNTYGGDGFFQLYEAERMNALIGNYYHKQSIGEFKKVGTVHLERR